MLGTMMACKDRADHYIVKIACMPKLTVNVEKNLYTEAIPPGTYIEVENGDTAIPKHGRIISII